MELSLDLNIMMIDLLLCLLVHTTHKKYCFKEESIYKLKNELALKLCIMQTFLLHKSKQISEWIILDPRNIMYFISRIAKMATAHEIPNDAIV